MAKPIEIKPQPRNAREELQRRLDNAPVEHADAMLSLYELLQQLYDSRTLDLLRGALGAGDEVLNHVVRLTTQPESVRSIRNLLIMAKLLSSIDPETLHRISAMLPQAVEQSENGDPPSLWALLGRFRSKDSRRALAAGATLLESVGRELNWKK
ncbi:DUF1641 domain-containing protein [Alloacidobacterium dinghuense]|uniref:DUF1641 domain-containing protein n=1 Tax=Alloacidobacterium dinghuense TaxID=2763107 RepID=A0A7G8BPZ7_9BACT|nr:DUF1641 domain-containing protein [Alloacidobacterium dinghuense]QNI34617.1 DUF1641 domain-containing protein [Alloacidobacterium dinghuense]